MIETPTTYGPIGPLRPGTYVIEAPDGLSVDDMAAVQDYLRDAAPEGVRFIILGGGLRMVRTEPDPDRVTL